MTNEQAIARLACMVKVIIRSALPSFVDYRALANEAERIEQEFNNDRIRPATELAELRNVVRVDEALNNAGYTNRRSNLRGLTGDLEDPYSKSFERGWLAAIEASVAALERP